MSSSTCTAKGEHILCEKQHHYFAGWLTQGNQACIKIHQQYPRTNAPSGVEEL